MKDITLIVGLPGSGKSFHANELCQKTGASLVDDPKDYVEILQALARSDNVVVCDPFLCLEHLRRRAVEKLLIAYPEAELHWIFFENDPERCLTNARLRDRNVNATIKRFAPQYQVPEGHKALPVWNGA